MSAGSTATVTITGKIGPGNTLTSVVLKGVTRFDFDVVNNKFEYFVGDTLNFIDITAATTVTITLSAAGGNYTVSVS